MRKKTKTAVPTAASDCPTDVPVTGAIVRGVIKTVKKDKGFGYIMSNDGVDRFFHRSACNKHNVDFKNLQEGDRVEFEKNDENVKGPRAEELRLL
jgi:cold shock CspA family protein